MLGLRGVRGSSFPAARPPCGWPPGPSQLGGSGCGMLVCCACCARRGSSSAAWACCTRKSSHWSAKLSPPEGAVAVRPRAPPTPRTSERGASATLRSTPGRAWCCPDLGLLLLCTRAWALSAGQQCSRGRHDSDVMHMPAPRMSWGHTCKDCGCAGAKPAHSAPASCPAGTWWELQTHGHPYIWWCSHFRPDLSMITDAALITICKPPCCPQICAFSAKDKLGHGWAALFLPCSVFSDLCAPGIQAPPLDRGADDSVQPHREEQGFGHLTLPWVTTHTFSIQACLGRHTCEAQDAGHEREHLPRLAAFEKGDQKLRHNAAVHLPEARIGYPAVFVRPSGAACSLRYAAMAQEAARAQRARALEVTACTFNCARFHTFQSERRSAPVLP